MLAGAGECAVVLLDLGPARLSELLLLAAAVVTAAVVLSAAQRVPPARSAGPPAGWPGRCTA